jgi:hypothetical protein
MGQFCTYIVILTDQMQIGLKKCKRNDTTQTFYTFYYTNENVRGSVFGFCICKLPLLT